MSADAAALLAAIGYASATVYKHWMDHLLQAFEHAYAVNRAVCETLIRGAHPGMRTAAAAGNAAAIDALPAPGFAGPSGNDGELLESLSQGLSCLVAEYAAEMDPSAFASEGPLPASRRVG